MTEHFDEAKPDGGWKRARGRPFVRPERLTLTRMLAMTLHHRHCGHKRLPKGYGVAQRSSETMRCDDDDDDVRMYRP